MPEITVTTTNNTRLVRIFPAITEAQHQVVKALGDRYILVLKAETPLGRGEDPGQLRGAYQAEQSYSATVSSYKITNTTPYQRFVIDGRGPVEAKAGGMLRFVIDGEVVFRKRVGPSAPNNFPSRAEAQMQPEIARAKAELPGLIIRGYRGG